MVCQRRVQQRVHTGFTLVELLVVVSIIALLAAILFPVFKSVREKSRQTSCLSNMRQIGMGLLMYLGDKGEKIPLMIQGQHTVPSGFGSTATASGHMEGPGIRIADYKANPSTPAERFSLADGGWPWTYYSWMDSIFPYVKSVEVFTCPSHSSLYPSDPSKYNPPYGGKPEEYPSETYSSPTSTEKRLRWYPSLAANGNIMWYGNKHWALSEINGPSNKILFVHNTYTYQYMNPGDYHGIAFGTKGSASTTRTSFPHNDGGIIIFVDGHAKWTSRNSVKKWTCVGQPGEPNTAGTQCGYWNPVVAPPV